MLDGSGAEDEEGREGAGRLSLSGGIWRSGVAAEHPPWRDSQLRDRVARLSQTVNRVRAPDLKEVRQPAAAQADFGTRSSSLYRRARLQAATGQRRIQ